MKNKVAFLVVSCDHYSDLWHPFFKTFHKYWSDCPYQLYLASNFKQYEDTKVKNIPYGEDQPFSTNLINILKNIEEDNIILWFEDAFITKKVNNEFVSNLINKAISLNIDHLKLTVDYPLYYGKETELFGSISRGVKYRSAIGMALYKKSTLDQILIPGESAWELDKSTRTDNLDLEFHSLNSKLRFNRPFTVINSVVKGKWIFNGPKFLKREGLENVINGRERQSIKEYLYIKFFLFRVEIFFLFKKYWYN
tara:strand:- start:11610 stop:12365 length:756 start_codon:yes stop_codon:yes gene_type:complete